jgi:glycosyltransferase involved in cell wall biosynthesis
VKIGLDFDSTKNWQGGRDFFRVLYESLQQSAVPDDAITVLATAHRDALPWRLARVGKHAVTRLPPNPSWMWSELRRTTTKALIRKTFGHPVKAKILHPTKRKTLSSKLFDVVGPLDAVHRDSPLPWLGYIPDCQHRKLPQFFSQAEIIARDKRFSALLQTAPVIIVNSMDAKEDLLEFFQPARTQIVSLPFAASPDSQWFETAAEKIVKHYSLPKRFFLCSNQFWQHKNHSVIFEALAVAKAEGTEMSVVFTGSMHDYRSPNYVRDLMCRAEELRVTSNCYFLDLIPKLDQIAIMRSAIAVIQPTLFEGGPGGGAVYDAVSVGQRVIVSDIKINREIKEFVDEYFDPSSPRMLYEAMCKIVAAEPKKHSPEALMSEGQKRRRHFGNVLRSAFEGAMKNFSSIKH